MFVTAIFIYTVTRHMLFVKVCKNSSHYVNQLFKNTCEDTKSERVRVRVGLGGVGWWVNSEIIV